MPNISATHLTVLILLCTGCATASVIRYPNAFYGPTNPAEVGVYYNFPPMQYQVVGEIAYNGAPAASWGGAGKLLQQEASKIGGDAVVIQVQDAPFVGSYVQPGQLTGSTYGIVHANTLGSSMYNTYGGTTYGSYTGNTYGSYNGSSNYQYTPPTVTNYYGKYIRGIVIKFSRGNQVVENPNLIIRAKVCPACGNRFAAESEIKTCPIDGAKLELIEPTPGN